MASCHWFLFLLLFHSSYYGGLSIFIGLRVEAVSHSLEVKPVSAINYGLGHCLFCTLKLPNQFLVETGKCLGNFPQDRVTTCMPGRSSTRVGAGKGVSSVCEPLPPDRPLWFPGSSPPEWLDGSLPGDFGFDPLGLGSDPELLKWFAQAELMHGRWAMLAVAGILIPEWAERLGFLENFSWFEAGEREYFADPTTLFVVQLALMGWVEGRRWADMLNPGSVSFEPKLPHKKIPKADVGYPGGLFFDPIMWGRGSPEPVMVLRTKEIKNGRLAMLAFVGFLFQALYTGKDPIENLMDHIADPGHVNIFSAFTSQY